MRTNPAKFELALARSGLMIQDVAKKAGVHRGTVLNMKRGGGSRPDTLGRVAKALGVDVESIVAPRS